MMKATIVYIALAAIALVLESGCSSRLGSSTSGSTAAASTSTSQAVYSAGCSSSTAVPTGLQSGKTMTVDGTVRNYDIYVTPGAPIGKALPITFFFHGNGGTPAVGESYNLQLQPATTGNYGIFVYPQGLQYQGLGVGWNAQCGSYDMHFVTQMLQTIGQQYCLRSDSTFAVGFSWGAEMVDNLDCCMASKFAGLVPVHGYAVSFYNSSCPGIAAVPTLNISGTADTNYTPATIEAAFQGFEQESSCSTTTTGFSPSPCVSANSCTAETSLCMFSGEGHVFDSSHDPVIWSFIKRHIPN